jgi:hypothetical protein
MIVLEPEMMFYMIHCRGSTSSCYYANGIGCVNIPFHLAERVDLQKITLHNRKKYIHNLFPVFVRFQKRVRSYVRWLRRQRSVRAMLQRELIGQSSSWAYRLVE